MTVKELLRLYDSEAVFNCYRKLTHHIMVESKMQLVARHRFHWKELTGMRQILGIQQYQDTLQ